MRVREVKAAAREWVLERGQKTPGFVGAYVAGSANRQPDDAEYPSTSDLDIMLVLEDPGDALKPGKFNYRGALLEASYVAREQLAAEESVLKSAVFATALRDPSILLDPTGMLTTLHQVVAHEFARRTWVRARCEAALERISHSVRQLVEERALDAMPLHDQSTATAFTAGIMCFPPLAAALKNLTVRKRYVAAREVLARYGRPDVHEELLALLGCAQMSRGRVEHHLAGMTEVFDAASGARRTAYRFGSDISAAARPISVDGSRELIERGLHREAVFWLVATHGRCRHILAADAPELLERSDPLLLELLADLGIETLEKRRARLQAVIAYLPRLREVTEHIMATNPEIQD
jgi:hypothetical protein